MAVDIGPRIGIDGEKQFRDELKNINQSLKTLDSEMKVVKSSFDGQKKSAEQLKKENEVLERSLLTLKDKLSQQEDALEKCAQKYGEADAKTMKWQQAVNETKAALNNAENAIKANTRAMDDYNEELGQTQTRTSTFGETFKGTFSGIMASKGFMLVVQAVQKLAQAAKDTLVSGAEYADEVNTMAAQTGLTTDAIQEFMYMSELVDVDVDTLTGSLSRLTRNMNSARNGSGNTAAAFERLRIVYQNGDGTLRNNVEVFGEIIDALGQIENATERDALAMDIFGKSAQDLNPLILAGKDQLQEYRDEANELGRVLSPDKLSALNGVDDDLYRIRQEIEEIKIDFLLENMDEIQKIMDELPELIDGISKSLKPLLEILVPISSLLGKITGFLTEHIFEGDFAKSIGGFLDYGIGDEEPKSNPKKKAKSSSRAAINIYPQSMTRSQTDYVINAANRSLGGKL